MDLSKVVNNFDTIPNQNSSRMSCEVKCKSQYNFEKKDEKGLAWPL